MIFSDRMLQLTAVVLDHDADAVTKELLRQGVLHMVKVSEVAGDLGAGVVGVPPEVSLTRMGEIRTRIGGLLDVGGLAAEKAPELNLDTLAPVDLDSADTELNRLSAAVQGTRERQRALQQEIGRLQEIGRQLELFRDIGEGLQASSQFSFLSIKIGSVPADRVDGLTEALKKYPSVQLSFQDEAGEGPPRLLVITMRRDAAAIDHLLQENGWDDGALRPEQETRELKQEAVGQIRTRVSRLQEDQEACRQEIRSRVSGEREKLETLRSQIVMNQRYHVVRGFFSQTARTKIFSGWVPTNTRDSIDAAIRTATQGRCYLEWRRPTPQELPTVPVKLRNPRWLSPFQMLVQNYSTPKYGTLDPTPIVAVAYLCMFGLMFADIGHGLVLAIIGLLGTRLAKKASRGTHELLALIGWCGGASIVTGALFGSTFGMNLFPPLWFDYHSVVAGHPAHGSLVKDVFGILGITLYFGIAVIGLGLLLNWVNLIATRQWLDLLLTKGGVLGAWIYGAGVYSAAFFIRTGYSTLPGSKVLFWGLGFPALLMALGPPLHYLAHHKDHPFTMFTVVDLVMEWIVEIMEVGTGYLANTLSFMRVAGLGIAHVSLMVAFFEIARVVSPGGGYNIWSILVLIVGNVMVILLEGLSAGIQSLRLNYYEFFSKYFSGSGRAYMPVNLKVAGGESP